MVLLRWYTTMNGQENVNFVASFQRSFVVNIDYILFCDTGPRAAAVHVPGV
jgi:hypothetical protein